MGWLNHLWFGIDVYFYNFFLSILINHSYFDFIFLNKSEKKISIRKIHKNRQMNKFFSAWKINNFILSVRYTSNCTGTNRFKTLWTWRWLWFIYFILLSLWCSNYCFIKLSHNNPVKWVIKISLFWIDMSEIANNTNK